MKTSQKSGLDKVKKIAAFAKEKANDLVILDIGNLSNICDYCVICSGDSPAQVKAIYRHTIKESRKGKIKIHHSEDDQNCNWMLIDYADIMVHVFSRQAREFYNLEYLYKKAKKIHPAK